MKNTTRLAGMLIVAATSSAFAAGPFQVRRELAGAALDGSAPVAVVTTAPFDESLVRSHDASNYFYTVFDASGTQLAISVQRLPGAGAVRIGFDDGNPRSAPVGAGSSSVAAAPASIQANGVQFTTITVVPRDTDGQVLGRGLAVGIDAALLWPLKLAGPVVDMGDGSYLAEATSTVPGTGSVRVTVEGVVLTASPSVEATALGGSLRDRAILQLRDLTSAGGRLDSIASRPARTRALEALRTLANDQPARDDNALKIDLDAALQELMDLGTPEAAALVDDILDIAWMIAEWNVEQARVSCGSCPVADAALAEADALRADPDADPSDVMDAYAWAVERALQALQHCGL
jgi:hypothetical protein